MQSFRVELESDMEMLEHTRLAGEAFREGLYIDLATAIAGTTVADTAVILAIQDYVLRSSQFSMRHLFVLGDTVRLLWADADPCMYGPYGPHPVIENYKLDPGFA